MTTFHGQRDMYLELPLLVGTAQGKGASGIRLGGSYQRRTAISDTGVKYQPQTA